MHRCSYLLKRRIAMVVLFPNDVQVTIIGPCHRAGGGKGPHPIGQAMADIHHQRRPTSASVSEHLERTGHGRDGVRVHQVDPALRQPGVDGRPLGVQEGLRGH